jgi:hypothetical protein
LSQGVTCDEDLAHEAMVSRRADTSARASADCFLLLWITRMPQPYVQYRRGAE